MLTRIQFIDDDQDTVSCILRPFIQQTADRHGLKFEHIAIPLPTQQIPLIVFKDENDNAIWESQFRLPGYFDEQATLMLDNSRQ